MSEQSATIGEVTHDGVTYEIDWPFQLDNEAEREDFAVVYRDGEQVAEFVHPDWRPFLDKEEVMDNATQFIEMGGVDDE